MPKKTRAKAKNTRELTPYNKFVKEKYHTVKDKHPQWTAPEVLSHIASLWKSSK